MSSRWWVLKLAGISVVGGWVLAASLWCDLKIDWTVLSLVGFLFGGSCYVLGRNDGWYKGHKAMQAELDRG